MGLIRNIFIRINASFEILGNFKEEFEVISKNQIYTVNINFINKYYKIN